MEHYATFVNIGGGVWSVVVMERDSYEDLHELARDYTDAERGTLDVLADLGWEPIGTQHTPIVSGAGMGYSRPVRRRPTPADAAETPLSASVLDVAQERTADAVASAVVASHELARLAGAAPAPELGELVRYACDVVAVVRAEDAAAARGDAVRLTDDAVRRLATNIARARGFGAGTVAR